MLNYANQMKQKSLGYAPKGIPGLNTGKNRSEQGIDKNKKVNTQGAGKMFKDPGKTGKGLASSRKDMSSSNTGPLKGNKGAGCNNMVTYKGVNQPTQFSNDGPKRTKFVI